MVEIRAVALRDRSRGEATAWMVVADVAATKSRPCWNRLHAHPVTFVTLRGALLLAVLQIGGWRHREAN